MLKTGYKGSSGLFRFCIEDPFETFSSKKRRPHDLGNHANSNGQKRIIECLKVSYDRLNTAFINNDEEPEFPISAINKVFKIGDQQDSEQNSRNGTVDNDNDTKTPKKNKKKETRASKKKKKQQSQNGDENSGGRQKTSTTKVKQNGQTPKEGSVDNAQRSPIVVPKEAKNDLAVEENKSNNDQKQKPAKRKNRRSQAKKNKTKNNANQSSTEKVVHV